MKTLNVPSAIVLATTIFSFLAAVVAALVLVPTPTWQAIGHGIESTPWTTVCAIATPLIVSMVAAVRQAWHGPVITTSAAGPVRVPPSSSTSGFIVIELALAVVLLALALLGIFSISGCGASAVHTHAIAAHSAHELLDASGPAITHGTEAELAACPHDDGDARVACIARVEHVSTIAASTHDLLAPEVAAYRAVTLTACGVDPDAPTPQVPDECPDDPAVLQLILAAATPVERDLPILMAAVSALGGL